MTQKFNWICEKCNNGNETVVPDSVWSFICKCIKCKHMELIDHRGNKLS